MYIYAGDFYYNVDTKYSGDNTDIGKVFWSEAVIGDPNDTNDTLLERLYTLLGLTGPAYEWPDKASAYIKLVINLFLGISSFIALVLVIYGFYNMFFSEQEEWYDKAKKIVIGASIALLIMGISWFIVTYIFSVYEITTETWPAATESSL